MDSTNQLFNRQRTVHQILGGGLVPDVLLWRRKNLTAGILVGTLAAWVVFENFGHTIVSLVSSVFLLLLTILFLWSKSAAIVNRPAPSLPHLHLSEEMVNDAAAFVRNHINRRLTISQDIASGKDSRMFVKAAACLLLISIIGSFTDSISRDYACLILLLTIPGIYGRYQDQIDRYAFSGYKTLRILYPRFCISRVHCLILEKKKLC